MRNLGKVEGFKEGVVALSQKEGNIASVQTIDTCIKSNSWELMTG